MRNLPGLAAGMVIPAAVGYFIVNLDEVTGMIQIQRFDEFNELAEVKLLAAPEAAAGAEDVAAVPRLPEPATAEPPSPVASADTAEVPAVASKGGTARPGSLRPPRTPRAVEKDITAAIKSNVAGEDPLLNPVWEGKSLGTMAEDLQALRAELVQSGRGNLLPAVDDSFMELSVPQFVKQYGSAELKSEFAALSRSRPGSPLYEEFVDFMSHGRVGTRKPDGVELRLGPREVSVRGELEVTDPTMKTRMDKVRVHEFKTRFYTEAVRRMVGPKGPVVRRYEVNTALGRRIEF